MTITGIISAECAELAAAFSHEVLVRAEDLGAPEGEIELAAHREDGQFRRIVLSTSMSSSRCEPRYSTFQIRRLALDVRAKVEARAVEINPAAKAVVVTIYPRHKTFDIDVTVTFR